MYANVYWLGRLECYWNGLMGFWAIYWTDGVDTPSTVMTTRASAVLKHGGRWRFPWRKKNCRQVKVYMKSRVKQTEDHLSYTVLRCRCCTDNNWSQLLQRKSELNDHFLWCSTPSMVAEIGGYSGLLLGFSLMDTVAVFSHITRWILSPQKPIE